MSHPITNHAQVRELALYAANERQKALKLPAKFTRCGQAFTDQIDAEVRALVIRRAAEHWQRGVTLQ